MRERKEIRFGDLVRESGRPDVVSLWVLPARNPAFTKAVRENRVLTVTQDPGRRDFGRIGFKRARNTVFLVFPKRLRSDKASRVIGINYALIEDSGGR